MLSCFQLLAIHLVIVNALVITMPDIVGLKTTTTINYVTESDDPSNWILRNVFANGTTQIGGTLSGSGSTTFAFQMTGPHLLQALALTDGTAASEPFYTGNLFSPVDLSATSSSTSQSSTATTIVSSSCPSSGSTGSTTRDRIGAIVGAVIGGLGFVAALLFFSLWFQLRREHRRRGFSQDTSASMHQIQFNQQNDIQTLPRTHSTLFELALPPLIPQHHPKQIEEVSPTTVATLGTSEASNPVPTSSSQGIGSQSGDEQNQNQSGETLRREVSLLRRELEEIRHVHSYDPPPTY
ncbi:hypothetical protein F5878DRAFT_29744 [Lentinula raphanica]|uniref:Transmembrane protein n=1 Tax=Lentinula raphanica TaxID=153919 RepID=A0AA38UGP9_9AGAR|nr:hypothetical protein F5880DRAFT_178620 [Lentinula raphanica]KAJ3841182.1 hypothetical protein F5878DRAFT_29744 [Lentinula raphanica]